MKINQLPRLPARGKAYARVYRLAQRQAALLGALKTSEHGSGVGGGGLLGFDVDAGIRERSRGQQLEQLAARAGDAGALPLAHRLRLAAAQPGHGSGATDEIDDVRSELGIRHALIVSRLTWAAQVVLQDLDYADLMAEKLPLFSPGERIGWAIEQSGKTASAIAAAIGCTHSAISQWRHSHTEDIKAGLLQRFADETGVELRWLLTGEGPVRSRYMLTQEMVRIQDAVAKLARENPVQVETVVRMLEAAAANDHKAASR